MPRYNLSSTFSQALRRLFQGAPNRRTRRAMRRSRTYSRPRLEYLESRDLLSSFTIQDLGTVSGGVASQANAINALGDVVGSVTLANGDTHAALWVPGQPVQDLGTLGGPNSSASAINILGEIVGSADTASATNQPFDLQPGGSMTNVNSLVPSSDAQSSSIINATGVDDFGVIVGQVQFSFGDPTPPVSYSLVPQNNLVGLNGFNLPNGDEIESGQATAVAGTSTAADAVANIVYLDHGNQLSLAVVADITKADQEVALPMLPNMLESKVFGISAPNSSGTQFAAGEEFDHSGNVHAVLWTIPQGSLSATASDLSSFGSFPLFSSGKGLAVNAEGDVVGSAVEQGSGQTDAFVALGGGGAVSLNTLLPPDSGITLTSATGINDSGQICAEGTINGQQHAFLLTPAPLGGPGTLLPATLTSAQKIDTAGTKTYSFVVTYSDAQSPGPIDDSTLANAIQVTGPNNFSQTASLVSKSGTLDQLAATYSITAPGGTWDFTDNGTYTVALNNTLKTTSGIAIGGYRLGAFEAAISVVRASVSGSVFNDANGNGKQDAGENGVSNTDVFIDLSGDGKFDSGDPVTTTDALGNYSFNGLLPGTYNIKELVVPPHTVSNPSNDVQTVTLSGGQNLTGVDFADLAGPEITAINGQSTVVAGFSGKTAQFDQPATVLHITGINFNALDNFFFGNDRAAAPMTNLQTDSNGVQTFDVEVPDFATTGPLVVRSITTGRFTTLLSTFTVDSYRNVNGYSFANSKSVDSQFGPYNFSDLKNVYGTEQTDITIDPCGLLTLGAASCTIDTGIPNPLAYLELAIINAALPPSAGECVGFSLSSARLSLGLQASYSIGQEQLGEFPQTTGGTPLTVWDMASPSGPSPGLNYYIHLAHLEQSSQEFLGNYVGQIVADEVLGLSNLINGVKHQLDHGLPVLICFQTGSLAGHCVLCYNVVDGGNGSEALDIYDPDLPFLSSEDNAGPSTVLPGSGLEDGFQHATNVLDSQIIFDSSGHWTYNGGAGQFSGGLANIAIAPLSVFNTDTLVASSVTSLLILGAFGDAVETQVTDSSGHTLLGADGSPNTDPKTMIPNAARYIAGLGAPPLDLIEGNGSFMQTIVGSGSGTYSAASMGTDAMATISGVSTVKGQIDKFGLDPSNDKLIFTPAATKNLTADLVINAPAGVQREVQLTSTATGGAAQTLQFQGSQRDHVVFNPGAAGSFTLNLTSNADGQVQTFTTGRMTLAAGDSVDVLPSDWADIQNATATVVVHHADGSSTTSTISNGGAGLQVNAKESVAFTAPVASFTNQTAAGKSAVIDWGDGTTSAGTVTASGANVAVSGSHTYAKEGYFPTRITLSDANGPLAQATGEAVVAFNKFTLAPANISAFAGVPFSGTVATLTDETLFTDIPAGENAGDFAVQIDWGDGTKSTGTLQETSPGQFLVQGSHTWTTTGSKSVAVTVTETGSGSGNGHTLKIISNTNFSGTVAQLDLPIAGSAASDYVATINWGDKTTSTGTLTLQPDGSVLLSGSHAYAAGNQSFATSFTVTGGPSATTTSTAVASSNVGTVTGTVFDDINGNGTMDPGEEGIAGQTVFIDEKNDGKLDPGDPSAVTNSAGVYTIANVPAGKIRVSEVVPSGFRVAVSGSGNDTVTLNGPDTLTLNAGQTLSNVNFANTQLALISGTVFVDSNGNGKHDPSEPGRPNQIVYLDLNKNGVLDPTDPTTITDATGAFSFTVNPGTYVVRLEPFSDFKITTPAGGAYTVTVGDGATNSRGLFGEQLPVTTSPPPHLPPPPPSGGGGSSSPPSPTPPPTLHTPPLLAFFDSLLGGIEAVNGNGTETVIDKIFGIPLLVSTYDGAGNLKSVTLFGIDVTALFESL